MRPNSAALLLVCLAAVGAVPQSNSRPASLQAKDSPAANIYSPQLLSELVSLRDSALRDEILAALVGARDDDRTRAVIITGAGRGFCSGGDVGRDFQYPSRYRGHRLESMLEMREPS